MKSSRVNQEECLLLILFVSLLLSVPMSNLQAEGQRTLIDCSRIENEEKRLACYDEIARLWYASMQFRW
jgi:hypothetical protein